jgi:hypothetical protein
MNIAGNGESDNDVERADTADGALSPGQTATGGPADANPFERGTGDPVGAGTVETPNVDGGRPDGDPEALIAGNRVGMASDMERGDPVQAAKESKETVTNDAVAGETVFDGPGDGNFGPTGGSPREAEPIGNNELDDEDIDLGTDLRDTDDR